MRFSHFAFAVMVFAFPRLLLAQTPQSTPSDDHQGFTFSTTSKLVVLDVVVTDKKGAIVTNLKKDDFEILEDGQLQRIESFESPAAHALPTQSVIHSTAELDHFAPDAPATIIVLDEISEPWKDLTNARDSIQRYLKNQPKFLLQPTMLVAVNVSNMIVLHDYTQDKDAILAAMDHYAPDAFTIETSNNPSWVKERVTAAFRSLGQVAKATSGHRGHKNVIWVGAGLPKFSKEKEPESVLLSPEAGVELQAVLQEVINRLVASRVTLYTIDLKGVTNPYSPVNDLPSLAQVAVATGGKPIYDRNDVDAEIDTSVRDGNEFYTLSYIPASPSDAKKAFRKIRIVMKDSGLLATTRTGYYPNPMTAPEPQVAEKEPGKPKRHDPQDAIDKTVADTTLVYDGIPLTLKLSTTPGQVVVWMDSDALRTGERSSDVQPPAKIQVSCVSFDKKGKILVHNGHNFEIPATTLGPHNLRLGIPLNQCNPDPRAVRLRVLVQAFDSGKVGAANLDLAAAPGR